MFIDCVLGIKKQNLNHFMFEMKLNLKAYDGKLFSSVPTDFVQYW